MANETMTTPDEAMVQIERDKLALEERKFEAMAASDHDKETIQIERDKLALEERKFQEEKKKKIWTAISTAAPLVTLAGTVAWGVYSLKETARHQFRLEAAKTIMSGTTPKETLDRLTMMRAMFPNEVPWLLELDVPDATQIKAKLELFRVMAARDSDPARALDVWVALFPGDDWAASPALRSAAQKPPQSR